MPRDCHFLLWGIFPAKGLNPQLLCLLCSQVASLPLAPPMVLFKCWGRMERNSFPVRSAFYIRLNKPFGALHWSQRVRERFHRPWKAQALNSERPESSGRGPCCCYKYRVGDRGKVRSVETQRGDPAPLRSLLDAGHAPHFWVWDW